MHRFEIGDILVLRKQHPCGSQKWEVWKIGMDIGIRCLGCNRKIRIFRTKLEKQIKMNQTEATEREV
ncbi:DUF951 domain-containing protein [Candidatus Poribacteria bacterium]|nr:DUF951 domain-containing protein [Candidatus Poribacteria bacterium]